MEFVIVRCSDHGSCDVFIDGQRSGSTEEVLEVDAGTHAFALCTCPGEEEHGAAGCAAAHYRPISQQLQVTNTFRVFPLEVRFESVS
jgi:hypothetical protein